MAAIQTPPRTKNFSRDRELPGAAVIDLAGSQPLHHELCHPVEVAAEKGDVADSFHRR